ncbi:hypothetical protein BH23BAC3_BH23BAC3_36450 [soil metagenome]
MIYLIKSLAAYLFCFGIVLSTNTDSIDSNILETKMLNTGECTLIVKTSTFWSAVSGESEVTGPCDKLVEHF